MKILLTGANGYIGQRLLPALVEAGHEVVAMVRSARRLEVPPDCKGHVEVIVGDLFKPEEIAIPKDIDAAYYLVHSLAVKEGHFAELEVTAAKNFLQLIEGTRARQVVYLSGLVSDKNLSPHLQSRKQVEKVLKEGKTPLTTLRAGIIIGSGSASFEIMRDLVEKLPVMVAPRWVQKKCQPIAIRDILYYLVHVLDQPECMGQSFDVGGPDVLTYREMLETLAEVRGLKRYIIGVPVLTPNLSSYWLYFVTSTNFALARALVESLKNNAICEEHRIETIIPRKCLSFKEALKFAFRKIESNVVISSWKDAIATSKLNPNLLHYIRIPSFGCFTDIQKVPFECDPERVLEVIWEIGGKRGWYAMNWAWKVRGFIDKIFGGAGLRRGRTHPTRLRAGDALDFWRVLLAEKEQGRLLLYSEMHLPGEAWLEFKVIRKEEKGGVLIQQATFRPKGVLGRLYWYGVYPIHVAVFKRMAKGIVRYAEENRL